MVEALRSSQTNISSAQTCIAEFYETRIIPSLQCILQDIRQWQQDISTESNRREKEALRDLDLVHSARKSVHNVLPVWTERMKQDGDQSANSGGGGFTISIGRVEDPWLLYLGVKASIKVAVDKINSRNASSTEEITTYASFEEALIKNFKTVISSLSTSTPSTTTSSSSSSTPVNEVRTKMFSQFYAAIDALNHGVEWKLYTSYHGHLMKNSSESVDSPALADSFTDEPLCKVLKEGILQRPADFSEEGWKESYFVITPIGYLYEFESKVAPETNGIVPKPTERILISNFYLVDNGEKDEIEMREIKDSFFKRGSKKCVVKRVDEWVMIESEKERLDCKKLTSCPCSAQDLSFQGGRQLERCIEKVHQTPPSPAEGICCGVTRTSWWGSRVFIMGRNAHSKTLHKIKQVHPKGQGQRCLIRGMST